MALRNVQLVQIGAKNYAHNQREQNDYYATDPNALEELLKIETFSQNIWECACGGGHLAEVLRRKGYNVKATDLIDRGYGTGGIDFLAEKGTFDGDIITNPPYKYALQFVEHALDLVADGHKVAMILKVQFLEGQERRKLFDVRNPKTVYVSSKRVSMAMNGDFGKYASKSAQAYAWFVWKKGWQGDTVLKWFNP